jgi:glycosyltransferase involved in cell wall biosynthesis
LSTHEDTWKRSVNVIQAYLKLKKDEKEVYKLLLFGQVKNPSLPEGVEYYYDPQQEQISNIYAKCHVWVVASDFEGIGMCAVEAMLTKTPLITTHTGGGDDFCTNKNCTFIIKNSSNDIYKKVTEVKRNYTNALKKANNAYNDILQFKWSNSINKIENIFLISITLSLLSLTVLK